MGCRSFARLFVVVGFSGMLMSAVGCASLAMKDNRFYCGLFSCKTDKNQAEKHRQRYQSEREPESICWLLANEIHSGMLLEEVNRVLGENGVREQNSRWITSNGGNYRADDVAYRWGPDAKGGTVYLLFREGKLVNFDPKQFEDRLAKATGEPPEFLD